MIAALLVSAALAADPPQKLVWNFTADGKPIGQRVLDVKFVDEPDGSQRRILQCWTELDGSAVGIPLKYRERLTASADRSAAAFTAVTDAAGAKSEVQARLGGTAWTLTIAAGGRESTRQIPANLIDLSSADLLDPATRRPLIRFDRAKLLSAETGDVWEGTVTRLGASTVTVAGTVVPVDGLKWVSPQGEATFYYTADGWLVQAESVLLGVKVVGTLTEPPPRSADDEPVVPLDGGISEQPL